jgi:hypothetical protein
MKNRIKIAIGITVLTFVALGAAFLPPNGLVSSAVAGALGCGTTCGSAATAHEISRKL